MVVIVAQHDLLSATGLDIKWLKWTCYVYFPTKKKLSFSSPVPQIDEFRGNTDNRSSLDPAAVCGRQQQHLGGR